MALPTSTIVMAVLTCIPFGLAIRDTVTGKLPVATGEKAYAADGYEDEDYAADNARREAEEAEEAAATRREEAKKEQLRVERRTLYGAEVATLGSGFAGLSLGMAESDIRSETVTALEVKARVDVELLANYTVDWITLTAERDAAEDESSEFCSTFGADLQEAWGRGQTEDYETRYWVNATTGTRASFSTSDGCKLSFERFVEPKAWVNKTRTSLVPLWLVGQPTAKLREQLGPRGGDFDNTERQVRWLGLGVGTGSGETRFEAHLAKGKVVAITATADTFEATRDEIIAQLSTIYGPAIEDDDGVHWKSRPAIKVDDHNGAGVRVTIGKLPDVE